MFMSLRTTRAIFKSEPVPFCAQPWKLAPLTLPLGVLVTLSGTVCSLVCGSLSWDVLGAVGGFTADCLVIYRHTAQPSVKPPRPARAKDSPT